MKSTATENLISARAQLAERNAELAELNQALQQSAIRRTQLKTPATLTMTRRLLKLGGCKLSNL